MIAVGCGNQEVTYRTVAVEGLPRCEQPANPADGVNPLTQPILLKIQHAGGKLEQTFSGVDVKPVVSLAERPDTVTVRVGRCEGMNALGNSATVAASCAAPTWLGEPQKVEIDPTKPDAKLSVTVPGPNPCLRDAPPVPPAAPADPATPAADGSPAAPAADPAAAPGGAVPGTPAPITVEAVPAPR
jgi:hypothetical protein